MLKILDLSKNLIIVTDYEKTLYANKTFLDFTKCSSLDEIDERGGLHSFLMPFEDAFYAGKGFKEWIEVIKDHYDVHEIDSKAYMMDQNLDIKMFNVNILPIEKPGKDNDLVCISFFDITDLEHERQMFEGASQYDELTKVFNRKKFNEVIEKEIQTSINKKTPLSVVMIDIDHFKSVNDTYGHLIGDETLKGLAEVVIDNVRGGDIFCRYGGEEFVLLMPKAPIAVAAMRMEHIRKAIEKHEFKGVKHITCSFGVAEYENEETSSSLIDRADQALYEAKKTGRNKVVKAKSSDK